MSFYGHILDTYEDPHQEVYGLISEYFDDMNMTKVEVQNNFAFYAARAPAMMLREFRYIIALVPDDALPLRSSKKLSELQWINFQTRTLEKDWRLSPQKWSDKTDPKFRKTITQTRRDMETDTFYYAAEKLPIEIALLTPKKTFPTYQTQGTFMRALETFQTVIIFTD
jgi:hypothetical protein